MVVSLRFLFRSLVMRTGGLLNRWAGHVPLRLDKTCEQCGTSYSVIKQREDSRFCSRSCRFKHDRTAPRKIIPCVRCGKQFESVQDHGVWKKYCSRKCFCAGAPTPTEKVCPSCDSVFLAMAASHRTGDGLRIYCSMKCRNAGLLKGELKTCVNCGNQFHQSPSKQAQRPPDSCCSAQCNKEYYIGSLNHAWKGGKYVNYNGEVVVNFERPNYVSKYCGEHRAVVIRTIKRVIHRTEIVIRINGIRTDNKPENLFVCGTIAEFRKRRAGSLPWPKKSNLDTYK